MRRLHDQMSRTIPTGDEVLAASWVRRDRLPGRVAVPGRPDLASELPSFRRACAVVTNAELRIHRPHPLRVGGVGAAVAVIDHAEVRDVALRGGPGDRRIVLRFVDDSGVVLVWDRGDGWDDWLGALESVGTALKVDR